MVDDLRFRAMGTDCHVIVVDGDASDAEWAGHEVRRLEALWTRFDDSSEISRANAATPPRPCLRHVCVQHLALLRASGPRRV